MFHYAIHGRTLASDVELPYLRPRTSAAPELSLRLVPRASLSGDATFWYSSEGITVDRLPAGDVVLRFADTTTFFVSRDGRAIELHSAPLHYTHGDLAAYALGTVLAVALHLQGATLLHASAVVLRDKAVLFAGDSGSGKSTTAAMLHTHGHRVLSDDVVEIDAELRAFPALPAIRLWPDAVGALYGQEAIFPDRAPSWDKKMIGVDSEETPREIAAILFLARGDRPMHLERLAPKEGWRRLIAHAYTARLPGAEMARRILDRTTSLAERVPMFSFAPPPMSDAQTLGAFLERALEERLR